MDQGFSYGDIIVIGAIAAFILLRYRAMLGEKSGRDVEPRASNASFDELERVIQLPATKLGASESKTTDHPAHYGILAESFVAMRALDRDFSPEEFLRGARAAYEMVHTAFNKADRATLKLLLSPELYTRFEASLTEEEQSGQRSETTLTAITRSGMVDASLKGTLATIAVEFASEQVHLTRDKDGAIIEGDPSHQALVTDRWVFTRTLTSQDPSWMIVET